jgi:hypothetical protein
MTRSNSGDTWDIVAEGLNQSGISLSKIQRVQATQVSRGATSGSDVMLVIDHSGSICPNASPNDQNCDAHKAWREAAMDFLEYLNPGPTANDNNVGFISFAGMGQPIDLNNDGDILDPGESYTGGFGKPTLQAHLNETLTNTRAKIDTDSTNSTSIQDYLKLSHGDGTDIIHALRMARCEFSGKAIENFNCSTTVIDSHDRADATHPDTIILITDGRLNIRDSITDVRTNLDENQANQCDDMWDDLKTEAQDIKNLGIKLYMIGVGSEMNLRACDNTTANPKYKDYSTQAMYTNFIVSDGNFVFHDYYQDQPDDTSKPEPTYKKFLDSLKKISALAGITIKVVE